MPNFHFAKARNLPFPRFTSSGVDGRENASVRANCGKVAENDVACSMS